MLFELKKKMKNSFKMFLVHPPVLKKEEFSQNKEGNIKTLTNSQRTKDTDIHSLFGHSPCHSARFGQNLQIQSQNKRTANETTSTSENFFNLMQSCTVGKNRSSYCSSEYFSNYSEQHLKIAGSLTSF